MRLRNIPGADDAIAIHSYVVQNAKENQNKWNEVFENTNPIQIEIGMGKGQFILSLAKNNPNINYIGIERYSSVLVRGLERLELEEFRNLANIKFLCIDARELPEIFGVGEIDKIYLNFSDPWPKARHARRRLTSKEFLKRYETILKASGNIEFKTDNRGLFDFSLEEVKEIHSWGVEEVTFDLHHDVNMNQNNIMTEYEEKFSSMGNPIHKMIIQRYEEALTKESITAESTTEEY